tara:strand:+ start:2353 stop:2781 length:429 start_codon:yes stop_codon:yes gene_type:complete
MAKVKRSVLKEIVKECLLEILFEGIDSEAGLYEEEEEPIREARQPRRTSRPPKSKSLRENKKSQKKQHRTQHLEQAVSELTNDPMMAAIYADTAVTTLQEQKEGRKPPVDSAAAVVDSVDNMEEVFPGAQNWAAIAFNEVDN